MQYICFFFTFSRHFIRYISGLMCISKLQGVVIENPWEPYSKTELELSEEIE